MTTKSDKDVLLQRDGKCSPYFLNLDTLTQMA